MRIAITVDPEIPVPPTLYGGIERIVDLLANGLGKRGHGVTLFANPSSQTSCELRSYSALNSRATIDTIRNMLRVSGDVLRHDFDLVHSFARLAYMLPILPLRIPKIMTYQRMITPQRAEWAQAISFGTLHFTGCSAHLIRPFTGRSNWHVVPNGVPIERFRLREEVRHDAPLVYLGRIEEIKGVHLAIEVAQHSGRTLIIAGNIPHEPHRQLYFRQRIQRHLDGKQVQYVGTVDDRQKDELLGKAAALLMPVLWDEPFGIVMAEALACGTPVIGLARGAVPEVVQNGINGFVCASVEEMVGAVDRIESINRKSCRRICEEKFSDTAVVEAYLNLYQSLVRPGTRQVRTQMAQA
jgi:glycosyltransferase involved in cell wall biosynthesis